ncbi:ADP-ribose pyrophosphatase [Candidatus Falkowbacteria bacterium CG10_big_fil_rev_8_21_14_0_10_39_11]|uniref:ADP-ribose pyrophosphatase n=1 Tax=Candidatus Falkowbacteria bacterium CG10_big_fil_rev_8_21_14_0_10_39_11 TaxID=1974565 RepID=A0A2H0V3N2_9BACT|nr:MAG: ADP-ribose pyrophosphatase [Candidatus Falkowbacteria bacterium CG10_big_fil_rev_8_21_14_0_10_39_11]
MTLLATITDKDFGGDIKKSENFNKRQAARAIIFDENGEIAIIYVSLYKHHSLPGGKVEDGEDLEAALKRECLEEAGCKVEIETEIGQIQELRNEEELDQMSHCYLARVKGDRKAPKFSESEKEYGFSLRFLPLEDALEKIKADKPESYSGKFIQKRDLTFIQTVADMF